MNAVVVYDTKFGNTESIAREIADALGDGDTVRVLPASVATEKDLAGIDLLAVGGPTQSHGLSPGLRSFLESLSPGAVRDVPTVTFDTRLTWPPFLAGSSAAASAKQLERKGAWLLAPPESFLVEGSKGPLVSGELEHARAWASDLGAAADLPEREPAAVAP